jgi:hypothetical protein
MTFTKPINFTAAVQLQSVKVALPTSLGSAELKALGGDILRRATFSARVQLAQFLDQVAGLTQDALAGKVDPATARLQLKSLQQSLGLRESVGAADGDAGGGFGDLRSDARLNLILDTNLQTAQGYGQAVRANDPDVLDAYPAQELYRLEDRQDERDWPGRWRVAAANVGDGLAAKALVDHGRMAALKSSPIWQELGDFFDDGLGNPYPPFAFRSGMWTEEVSYEDAVDLGLISPGAAISPAALPDFNTGLESSYEFRSQSLLQELLNTGLVKLVEGVLTPA